MTLVKLILIIENIKRRMNRQYICVVGLGNISTRHRKNIRKVFKNSYIIGLSSSQRNIADLPHECDLVVQSLKEVLEYNIQLAIIASPATMHYGHAHFFISNNIPTLIEKPIAASLTDAHKIQASAYKYKTPVAVGYCLRYMPSARIVKETIKNSLIGDIYNIHICAGEHLDFWRKNKDYRESVSALKKLGGGVLLELSHEIDYLCWLIEDVKFQSSYIRNSNYLDIDKDIEDAADIIFKISNGTCTMHLDFLQTPSQRHATFYGTKGRLEWDIKHNTVDLITIDSEKNLYNGTNWDKNNMYLDMLNDFRKYTKNKSSEYLASVKNIIKVIELINQIKSFEEGESFL